MAKISQNTCPGVVGYCENHYASYDVRVITQELRSLFDSTSNVTTPEMYAASRGVALLNTWHPEVYCVIRNRSVQGDSKNDAHANINPLVTAHAAGTRHA